MRNILKAMVGFVGMAVIMSVTSGNTVHPVFGASIGQQEQIEDNMILETSKEMMDRETDEEIVDEPEEEEMEKPVLYAASKPNGKIKISWEKIDGAVEYVLLRSTKKDGGFRKIYKTKAETSYYMDKKRTIGKVYYYQLAVFSEGRTERVDSKIIAGRSLIKAELTEISNLSGSRKLVLHWKHVKGAAGYQIERKSADGKFKIIADVRGEKNSFADTKRYGGKIYTYRVCAKDACGGRGNYSKPLNQMAIDGNRKMIALTYDDGPSKYTSIVLDALEKYSAHATFFVVGNQVNRYGGFIRREAALGCEIGNHTFAHNNLKTLSVAQVRSVISKTNQAVKKQSGVDICIMRPPGGNYNSTVRAAVGMPVILWSVDTLDWRTRNTAATIQCVKRKANDGDIVLMHDLHQPTAKAADAVIMYLKTAGYQMVTVSELAAYRGGMMSGKVYNQFRK